MFLPTWHLISNPKINYNVLYMYIWTWWKSNVPYCFQMLDILKMIIIYCIGYVNSHTMAFVNEEKITSNRRHTIQLLYWFNVAIINLCTGAHQLIFLPFELAVAITCINLRTGAHQLIFQSFVLTVATINLRTEHIYLFSSSLPQKYLIKSMQVIK